MHAEATFDVLQFDQEPPFEKSGDLAMARSHIQKVFRGDIDGTSRVEMLGSSIAGAPAAYVALERFEGTVHGRSGSFVLLHAATQAGGETWGRWLVVPGSGTGQLRSLQGEGRIDIAENGRHSLSLDYSTGQ